MRSGNEEDRGGMEDRRDERRERKRGATLIFILFLFFSFLFFSFLFFSFLFFSFLFFSFLFFSFLSFVCFCRYGESRLLV